MIVYIKNYIIVLLLKIKVLIDFPLQIIFGYYAAKWSSGKRPLKPVITLIFIVFSKYVFFFKKKNEY